MTADEARSISETIYNQIDITDEIIYIDDRIRKRAESQIPYIEFTNKDPIFHSPKLMKILNYYFNKGFNYTINTYVVRIDWLKNKQKEDE